MLGEQGLNGSDTFTWTYDAAYRLTGETRVNFGTTTYQASYSYDAVGNRTSATINGQTTNYTYNSLDQLTSTSAGAQDSYDGRGNLTQITLGSSTTSYSYDAADRLTRVTLPNGTSASYAYDAAGRRVQQTVGTSVTNYLWDEASTSGDVVQETDGNGVTQASYVLGDDEVLAQTRSGAVSYYLSDGQGNVRLLTDGNGAVTDRYSYDAFGNLLSSQGSTINPYRYTGQQLDSLTGLYDLRARYYDPTSGRFLSRDTAGIDVSNPVEVNRYSYAEENPVNFTDPSGHGAFAELGQILYQLRYYILAGAIVGLVIALDEDQIERALEDIADFLARLWAQIRAQTIAVPVAVAVPATSTPSAGCPQDDPNQEDLQDTESGGRHVHGYVRGPETNLIDGQPGKCHINVQVAPPEPTPGLNIHVYFEAFQFKEATAPDYIPRPVDDCGRSVICAAYTLAEQASQFFNKLTGRTGQKAMSTLNFFADALQARLPILAQYAGGGETP